MFAKYSEGQKVRIVALIDGDGRPDLQIQRYVSEVGAVVKAYCVTKDEMPDLSKMFVYPDVYCYDIQFDGDGTVLSGIPEVALEPYILRT